MNFYYIIFLLKNYNKLKNFHLSIAKLLLYEYLHNCFSIDSYIVKSIETFFYFLIRCNFIKYFYVKNYLSYIFIYMQYQRII